jgi:hypothetical protein
MKQKKNYEFGKFLFGLDIVEYNLFKKNAQIELKNDQKTQMELKIDQKNSNGAQN